MANIKSQIKRNRQNEKKRLRNRVYRGEARIAVRDARTNIEEGAPESKAALLEAIRALDKAAEQGVIHRNNAGRRKSRLVKAFARMTPAQTTVGLVEGEPVLEAAPVEKSSPRKRTISRKVEEPHVDKAAELTGENTSEPKTETKKVAVKSSPKEKKGPVKKTTTTSSTKEKKAAPRTSSPKEKKPAAGE